jgi:hypothetical protein
MTSSWSEAGRPVPFLAVPRGPGGVPPQTPEFEAALADTLAVEQAMIPLERIQGPMLFISAADDGVWPSPRLAELAMSRLAASTPPYPSEHVTYPCAGHSLGPPCIPTTVSTAVRGRLVRRFGGSAASDALARWDSWHRTLRFLRANLAT